MITRLTKEQADEIREITDRISVCENQIHQITEEMAKQTNQAAMVSNSMQEVTGLAISLTDSVHAQTHNLEAANRIAASIKERVHELTKLAQEHQLDVNRLTDAVDAVTGQVSKLEQAAQRQANQMIHICNAVTDMMEQMRQVSDVVMEQADLYSRIEREAGNIADLAASAKLASIPDESRRLEASVSHAANLARQSAGEFWHVMEETRKLEELAKSISKKADLLKP